MDKDVLMRFWLKRLIGIIPMYYIAAVIYNFTPFNPDSWIKTLLIGPVEILGIQSMFSSLFENSHNGGTWFISCILFCYFIYPFLQELIKQISVKTKRATFIICGLTLLYAPLVAYIFETDNIYSNPFFRLLEFIMGMILASAKLDYNEKQKQLLYNWFVIIFAAVAMFGCVTLAVHMAIAVGNYMLYNWICLPCFSVILTGLTGVSFHLKESRVLTWFCGASYVFFLAQLYSNSICKIIISRFQIKSNWLVLALGWGICILIAAGFRSIEKPLKRWLERKLLKPEMEHA